MLSIMGLSENRSIMQARWMISKPRIKSKIPNMKVSRRYLRGFAKALDAIYNRLRTLLLLVSDTHSFIYESCECTLVQIWKKSPKSQTVYSVGYFSSSLFSRIMTFLDSYDIFHHFGKIYRQKLFTTSKSTLNCAEKLLVAGMLRKSATVNSKMCQLLRK